MRIFSLTLSLLLVSNTLARAQVLGQDGAPPLEGTRREDPSTPAPKVLRVPGFDPVRDVPYMRNWKGDIDRAGAGMCYALGILTSYFHGKVEFVEAEGVPYETWRDDERRIGDRPPVRLDDDGLELLYRWLAVARQDVGRHGKLKVGGFAGLREMTRPSSAAEARFRQIAEAIQYTLQVGSDLPRVAGSILKSHLAVLPGAAGGSADVNRQTYRILAERIEAGRLVPLALHADGIQLSGHVLLAHEIRAYPDRIEVLTHDVNSPPVGETPDPAVITLYPEEGWRYEVRRADGVRRYEYALMTAPDPESRGSRVRYVRIAANYREHLERMSHLGDLLGKDRSFLERARGAAGYVLEVLNPF